MNDIKESMGAVIASDTQHAAETLDAAILAQARLCASLVEVNAEVKLSMQVSQRILQSATNGLSGIVATRAELLSVIKQLIVVQDQSNLQPVSFGCPNGYHKGRTKWVTANILADK